MSSIDVEIQIFNKREKYLTHSMYQAAQLTCRDNCAHCLGEHSSEDIFSKHIFFMFCGSSYTSADTALTRTHFCDNSVSA